MMSDEQGKSEMKKELVCERLKNQEFGKGTYSLFECLKAKKGQTTVALAVEPLFAHSNRCWL